ncbi:MAG: GNAT family N-acetyltransferase [Vulcanimicrobiaceae bacterium]
MHIFATDDESAALHLRPARNGDAFELARLRALGLVEMELLAPPQARAFERDAARAIFAMLRSGELEAWVAESAGRLVGCAHALFWRRLPYVEGALHAEVAGVYVEPQLRGNGIATELVREAIAAAQAAGVRKITLSSTDRARSLYARLGFVERVQMQLTKA